MKKRIAEKSIGELAPLIKLKTISPVEVTESILSTIREKNAILHAYINTYETDAIGYAKQAEQEIMDGRYRGPLHGIPMALKDNLFIKGENITVGSKIHENFIPDYNATVVERLKSNGVIFTGTLNMHEYALGNTTDNPYYGTCRNPWDHSKTPSGSSGGSAVAVSANMAIASLGTETGGSIRTPSSVCGIVGLKPTFGRVSRYGCFPLSSTLDHIGPMTKTVYDTALLLEVLAGQDQYDLFSSSQPVEAYTQFLSGNVKGIIIGVCEDFLFYDVDPAVASLVNKAINKLEKLGAHVERINLSKIESGRHATSVIMASEARVLHDETLRTRPEDFGADIKETLLSGEQYSAVDYIKAIQTQDNVKKIFKKAFEKVDVIIAPTTPFTAASVDNDYVELNGRMVKYSDHVSRLIRPGTLAGIPAITLPCGFSDGMPVGLQVMGDHFDEKTILNVARAVERLNLMENRNPRFNH